MNNLIEKDKTNKLRPTLIGISIFLFSFITIVSLNNIYDTYAVETKSCWHCDIGDKYEWSSTKPEQSCASTWTIKSGWTEETCKPGKCWHCDVGNKYEWSETKPEQSCASTWILKSELTGENCNPGKCWHCDIGDKYEWSSTKPEQSCASTWIIKDNITTPANCSETNIKTLKATFNATGDGTLSGYTTAQCITTKSNPNSCKVLSPSATRNGYYLKGWSINSSCYSYSAVDSENKITLTNSFNGNLYTCWGVNAPSAGDYNPGNDVTEEPEETEVAYTRPIYTITYDLDGGKFIDGTTSRVSYIPSDKKIGDPQTNPIKDGMKFKEWQLNGTKFNFDQKPTKNITLKAVYEKLTEEDKLYYCESDSDVLDLSTKVCYNVMKPDESKKLYNYTLYSYIEGGTFCYAYNATNNTPGGVYFRTDVTGYKKVTGKQDTDYSVYGYPGKEAWVSKDTCLIATECTEDASVNRPACETRWDAIIYSAKAALLKEEKNDNNTDKPINSDTPSNDGKDNNDKDVPESPKTGDALILVAWTVGIAAIGYTVYYFRKKEEN